MTDDAYRYTISRHEIVPSCGGHLIGSRILGWASSLSEAKAIALGDGFEGLHQSGAHEWVTESKPTGEMVVISMSLATG